jgi:hypothetical protein
MTIEKAKKVKSDTSKLVKSLKCIIRKGYDLAIIVYYLRKGYLAKNNDNLSEQLVGPISKYISTSIFHSVLYYCFVQYLIAIV